jgi:hypothetical protein
MSSTRTISSSPATASRKAPGNVVWTCTAGYATTPKDLEQAVLEIIALKFRERERVGVSSKTLAGEMVSFFRNVSTDTIAVIDNYKRVVPV